jgi:hypothetical protein
MHGQTPVISLRPLDRVLQRLAVHHAVAQAGQAVVARQMRRRGNCRLEFL